MKKFLLACCLFYASSVSAKTTDVYLFYNAASENLAEIDLNADETAFVFDDVFGPASDELPDKVKFDDFFVSKFPNGDYVFMLNSSFNCGQLGCNTEVYKRDVEGDLVAEDSTFPLKCTTHGSDKLLCVKGGYKVEKKQKPKKRGPVHYLAPKEK